MINKNTKNIFAILSSLLLLIVACVVCIFAIPRTPANAATSDKLITTYVDTYKNNFLKYLNKNGGSYSFYKAVEDGDNMIILYKDKKTYTLDYNQNKDLLSAKITAQDRKHKDETVTLSVTSSYSEGSSSGVSTSLTVGVGGGIGSIVSLKGVVQFDFDYSKSITNTKENTVSVTIPVQITQSEYSALKNTDVYNYYSYSYTDPKEGSIYALKTGQYSLLSKVQVKYYYYITLKKAQVYESQKTTNKGKTEYKDVDKAEKIWVLENDNNRIKYDSTSRTYSVSTSISSGLVYCAYDMSQPSYAVSKIN